ncbi:FkbM family methyltransferase [Vibrio cholerae]|nr:FkbM family methyltransferase [Vibrio cholerae]
MSLDNLCAKYSVQDVHFLKIDVEGAEKDVLESFSFDTVRPWIEVVETTKPKT